MTLPIDAICCPPMTPTVRKSPMTTVMTKIEPIVMPVFDKGSTTSRTAPRAGVARGFDQRAVDAHHRIEDRYDHEHGIEVNERQHDGKARIQKPLERAVD